jgi:hypothetical protein
MHKRSCAKNAPIIERRSDGRHEIPRQSEIATEQEKPGTTASFGPRAPKYAANRLITLPELARRGAEADQVVAATNQAVAAAAQLDLSDRTQSGSIKLRLADSQPRPIRSPA